MRSHLRHAPRRHAPRLRALAIATALVLGAGACTDSSADQAKGPGGTQAPKITTKASFEARGSVEQAYVKNATPGQQLVLADKSGTQVASGTADDFGSLIVRDLAPGDGYTFRGVDGSTVAGSDPFRVLSIDDHPAQDFYAGQQLKEGLNYLTVRDGVQLAATVRLPQGKKLEDGPFPTVIEYSGYAVAPPGDPLKVFTNPDDKDPLIPSSSTAVGGIIAPLLGFATVSLQMRGSGCSGGAMGLFDLPTTADGYDAVETIAAQPWAKGGKVGMVGISFSGISQWFVAGSQPPHLAAIAPFSPTDDLYSIGFPGGIYNNGFAASWLAERVSDAKPGPEGGQPWVKAMIEKGDQTCADNQKLRLQTQDVQQILKDEPTRDPKLYDARSTSYWASKVKVPVFAVGAAQDEQTGGQWFNMISELQGDTDVFATYINGTHVDSLGPATITRWVEFLDLFVADQVPTERPAATALGSQLYRQLAGADSQPVPKARFTDAPNLEAARAEYRKDPRVRILMDNGGDPARPGALGPMWETGFSAWPPPVAEATSWYLGPNGELVTESPAEGTVSFTPDPSARPKTSLPKGDAWAALPPYEWAPVTGGTGLGFVSRPLTNDLTVVGPASLDLTLASTATDTDLQVAVSEVRPDGQEMYVQSGWLRASARKLDEQRSTALHPVHTYAGPDRQPLTPGEATSVRVALLPIMYTFRAGSRLRITITAPGGDRPSWQFDTPATDGKVTNTLSLGGVAPSKLVLPVIAGVTPGDAQPLCPSLRGQPCRTYAAAGNGG